MIKSWSDDAWGDYLYWQAQDRKTLRRINALIRDIDSGDPFTGIGKPEPLRHGLAGKWSRRIDEANRLVYAVSGDVIMIYSCKDHY